MGYQWNLLFSNNNNVFHQKLLQILMWYDSDLRVKNSIFLNSQGPNSKNAFTFCLKEIKHD